MSGKPATIPEHIRRRAARLIGELKAERERRGWSMSELGRRSGVSQPTISDLENRGVDPTLTTYLRLAQVLGRFPYDQLADQMSLGARTYLRNQEWARGLRVARERAELTQWQLATKLGMNQSCISQWETGNVVPRLSTYLILAEAVGVRV